ncbi:hypothetical protein [uncultured Roseobacter sp.]|uniref:Pepco domain-containing protein n=1 Tax=uncultured Roseobacter sp. TaxID=114847 RepID=UPI00263558EB|nr:hypothetical protein [uncultured Roseobacter sp.]
MANEIQIFGPTERTKRSPGKPDWNAVDQGVLQTNLDQLITSLRETFTKLDKEDETFSVSEIEVSVGVSASGKVGLLGTGVEAEGTASLTVKFQRS